MTSVIEAMGRGWSMRCILALGFAAALGACGKTFDETASALQPGQWEETSTETRVLAGEPLPSATVKRCISEEEAGKAAAFMPEWGQSNCTVSEFTIGKGRVRGEARCDRPDGTVETSFEGQLSSTAYEIASRIDSDLAGKKRIVEERTTARRLGDCPEGEENQFTITV
jgi:hypothetical protein